MTDQENIDPQTRERNKTREEQAEDIAYTVNHALSCGTTDILIQPFASAWIDTKIQEDKIPRWLRWVKHLFENHDHHGHGHGDHCGHDHGHHHHHGHDHKHKISLWDNTKHWVTGEVLGDVGAVPLTVMVQRIFPGFMHSIRKGVEPMVGHAFRDGAHRDAQKWALKQGINPYGDEAKKKEQALYEHEMSHLPQAVVWNAFSIPINLGSQWAMAKAGHKPPIFNLVVGKTFGTLVSNTALIGTRAVAPEMVNEWDSFNSKHVIRPLMKIASAPFGGDQRVIDRVTKAEGDWGNRIEEEANASPTDKQR